MEEPRVIIIIILTGAGREAPCPPFSAASIYHKYFIKRYKHVYNTCVYTLPAPRLTSKQNCNSQIIVIINCRR